MNMLMPLHAHRAIVWVMDYVLGSSNDLDEGSSLRFGELCEMLGIEIVPGPKRDAWQSGLCEALGKAWHAGQGRQVTELLQSLRHADGDSVLPDELMPV
jgi:hypothetical protein